MLILKPKDILFLRAIYELKKRRFGISPSTQELQKALCIASTSTVFLKIRKLKALNLVDFQPKRARTLHLTQPGKKLIEENDMQINLNNSDFVLHLGEKTNGS